MEKGLRHGTYGNKVNVNNLICDLYETPYACYSLRKLRRNYNGPAIEVKNPATGIYRDIYFNGNGIDISGLRNHIAGSSASYVRTLYDQSGNNRHLYQADEGKMPGISSYTDFVARNNLLAMGFDGVRVMEVSSSTGINISPKSFFCVCDRLSSLNSIRTIFSTGILAGENGYGVFLSDTTNLPPPYFFKYIHIQNLPLAFHYCSE